MDEMKTQRKSLVSGLKDYVVRKLNVEDEISMFKKRVNRLRDEPSFVCAEDACRGSRKLFIAVEENTWALGAASKLALRRRANAIALIKKAALLREKTLDAIPTTRKTKAEHFFDNIEARQKDLASSSAV